jgi:hypothetical protein
MDSLSTSLRRSGQGASNYVWQVQAGAGQPWVEVWSTNNLPEASSNSSAIPISVDLSRVPSLQKISSGQTVTFRIVPWQTTQSGGAFYLVNNLTLGGYTLIDASQPSFLLPPQNVKAESASASRINLKWDAVTGATGYEVDVYWQTGVPMRFVEDFEDYIPTSATLFTNAVGAVSYGEPPYNATELSTVLPGWSGSSVYPAYHQDVGGTPTNYLIRLGTANALGWIQTPPLDIVKRCDVEVSFDIGAWNTGSEQTSINLVVADVRTGVVATNVVSGLSKTAMERKTLVLTDVPALFTLRFSAHQAGNSRFFLDNVTIVESEGWESVFSGTVPGTVAKIDGLTDRETYWGVVRAVNTIVHLVSPDSDEFCHTLKAPGTVVIVR